MSGNRETIRFIILTAIVAQNAVYTLARKYSTMTEKVASEEILFIAELLKIVIATTFLLNDKEPSDAQGIGLQKLIWLIRNSSKMFVLAAIYAIMNILSFIALEYIGAGEFTVCAQLKILTTAGFSVLILGTSLTSTKWRALGLLVLGCILVASPSFDKNAKQTDSALAFFGYAAVLSEVVLSGFASIYFEKVIKSKTEIVTIWERNFQLGFYSLIVYSVIMTYKGQQSSSLGAFKNWSFLTFSVSFLGAAGGLLVAATLKYADSILKTLAAAGAIVISTILGHYLLAGPLGVTISIGACVTIIAISNYTLDTTPAAPIVQTTLNSDEEALLDKKDGNGMMASPNIKEREN